MELDKILTMSFSDYCDMKNAVQSDYEAKGVHSNPSSIEGVEGFAGLVPKDAEAVVDYKFCVSNSRMYCSGTALIKRK